MQKYRDQTLDFIFKTAKEWERSFVYLEEASSVQAIVNAFDWLEIIVKTYIENKSIYEVIGLDEPTKNSVQVYGSNIYWKRDRDEFEKQLHDFDFSKTKIIKAHLGRNSFEEEREKYKLIAKHQKVEKFMVVLWLLTTRV